MAAPKADPEVEAMAKLVGALDGLDPDIQGRVVRWVADRYGVTLSGKARSGGGGEETGGGSDPSEYEELSDRGCPGRRGFWAAVRV